VFVVPHRWAIKNWLTSLGHQHWEIRKRDFALYISYGDFFRLNSKPYDSPSGRSTGPICLIFFCNVFVMPPRWAIKQWLNPVLRNNETRFFPLHFWIFPRFSISISSVLKELQGQFWPKNTRWNALFRSRFLPLKLVEIGGELGANIKLNFCDFFGMQNKWLTSIGWVTTLKTWV